MGQGPHARPLLNGGGEGDRGCELAAFASFDIVHAMDLKEFRASLERPDRAYILKTDQDYLKKQVFELAREQVDESARDFDWAVFDLTRDAPVDVVNAARTLPWMSPRRWIYVRSADSGGEALVEYLKDPAERTVLILEFLKKPPKGLKLPVIEMPPRADAVGWVLKRASDEGFQMAREAARTLTELVGEDFQRLDSELEKLMLFNFQERKIDRKSVLAMTSQAQHYDVFALVGALAGRRAEQALKILNRLFEEGMTPPQIVATLAWNFRRLLVARELLDRRKPFYAIVKELKIWSYRSREREIRSTSRERFAELLIRLREVDRLCKTTGGDEKALLERLVVDTCGSRTV